MPKTLGIIIVCLAALASSASAADWRDYPQFRHVSGLPGSAAPVTQDGQLQFGGALHMNIPCAYTPAEGNYSLLYASASRDSAWHLGLRGHYLDGSVHAMLGFGKPGHGIAVTGFAVDETWRNTINLQWQATEETVDRPALAVGIMDIFDQRQKRQGIDGGARSFYITATRKLIDGEQPVYGTVGLGDGRFNGIFGGVSWYPAEKINLGAEYDGRIGRVHGGYELYSNGNFEAIGWAEWANFERPGLGLTLQYHP